MRINFLSRIFGLSSPKPARQAMQSVSPKVSEIKSKINLAEKAEKRLQSRLTDYGTLMRDVHTGDYFEINTGKKFTGKFSIQTDNLEHLQHVKDGKTVFICVRDKNGNKHLAIHGEKRKIFGEKELEGLDGLAKAHAMADEEMRDKFVINELMKSGKDSICIQGNF